MRRDRLIIWTLAWLGIWLAGARIAHGETVTLSPRKDNTLFENLSGSLSSGAGKYFYVGRTGQFTNFLRRGLVDFDIAGGIPAGSTIIGVRLTLTMSKTIAGGTAVTLHRARADWGEGSSDAEFPFERGGDGVQAANGDATWIHRSFPSTFWSVPGGEFEASASASAVVAGFGAYTWESAEMVRDVQAWLDEPAANFGWLIKGVEGTPITAKRFNSREYPDPGSRPALVVDFEPPAPSVPASSWWGLAILVSLTLLGGSLLLRRAPSASTGT